MVSRANLLALGDSIRAFRAMIGLALFFLLWAFCNQGLAQNSNQKIDLMTSVEGAKSSLSAKPLLEFSEPLLEDRYRVLIDELRCPKCQNQNLADSDAPIAKDLRRELHRLLEDGKDNDQILDFMTLRYGEFVRYRPSLTVYTSTLWLIPAMVLFAGVVILFSKTRGKAQPVAPSKTADGSILNTANDESDALDASQADIERRVKRLLAQANDND